MTARNPLLSAPPYPVEQALKALGASLLTPGNAEAVFTAMRECIRSQWYRSARACGVSEADCGKIGPAFLYEGFFL